MYDVAKIQIFVEIMNTCFYFYEYSDFTWLDAQDNL